MSFSRRALLGGTGAALATWGLSAFLPSGWVSHQQVLAQPVRRKLALLVGIDAYPDAVLDIATTMKAPLQGCVTDVKLQREVLIHRFGFQPADVRLLIDGEATWSGITQAFTEHLINQVKPGDVVVFHFSGYGSQVRLMEAPDQVKRSLVPVDGLLPTEESPVLHDLLLDTLALMLQALQTQQVTTVLDASFPDLGTRLWGNLRTRSRPNIPTGELSSQERELQVNLQDHIRNNRPDSSLPSEERFPGILLMASQPHQVSVEGHWQGFSAGVFTYALTQQLWWAMPDYSLGRVLNQAAVALNEWVGPEQQPQLRGLRRSATGLLPYDVKVRSQTAADGVVLSTAEEGRLADVWLGGIPAPVLEYYSNQSRFSLVDGEDVAAPIVSSQLQLSSRSGLVGQVRLGPKSNTVIRPGQLIHEALRILPRNIDLIVALDSSLERIERVDATSALSTIPFVSSTLAGEQPADCLFGKVPRTETVTLTAALPRSNDGGGFARYLTSDMPLGTSSYGLFSAARELMPGSLASGDEAIKTAVTRLTPQFQTLLANKLLRLTNNRGSSRLAVQASLEIAAPQERILIQLNTSRMADQMASSRLAELLANSEQMVAIPSGSSIQYQLTNLGERPVYFTLLDFDNRGRVTVLNPAAPVPQTRESPAMAAWSTNQILPGDKVRVPFMGRDWIINGSSRLAETFVIFSPSPLAETFQILWSLLGKSATPGRMGLLSQPLAVAQAVLNDLHQASVPLFPEARALTDSYVLNVDTWATLNFGYEII